MAKLNFGGVVENVVTRDEFPLAKALETLKMRLSLSSVTVYKVQVKH